MMVAACRVHEYQVLLRQHSQHVCAILIAYLHMVQAQHGTIVCHQRTERRVAFHIDRFVEVLRKCRKVDSHSSCEVGHRLSHHTQPFDQVSLIVCRSLAGTLFHVEVWWIDDLLLGSP